MLSIKRILSEAQGFPQRRPDVASTTTGPELNWERFYQRTALRRTAYYISAVFEKQNKTASLMVLYQETGSSNSVALFLKQTESNAFTVTAYFDEGDDERVEELADSALLKRGKRLFDALMKVGGNPTTWEGENKVMA